jgi:tungstate transport system ATP-binding protein
MELKLIITDIRKTYNGKPVLNGCSYSFEKNGVYALMGPNGCGKSTLLRICALLEEPDEGTVIFLSDSSELRKDIHLKRRITLVLPRIGVFNTSVYKNVAFGLKIRRMGKDKIAGKVEEVIDFVRLAHKKDQNALTLSSGETQRLGIARALVIKPEILFLDEPTASVDQENTEIIEDILLRMRREARSTVIITTHDASQAERLAGRVLIMKDGRIVEQKK